MKRVIIIINKTSFNHAPNKPVTASVSTMPEGKSKVSYGTSNFRNFLAYHDTGHKSVHLVRLGSSGLKVSQLILGCMTYGSPEWQKWVLPEEESIKHIKAA